MENIKIAAGIVLYNPDICRLKKNIDSIISQVIKVLLFDNGSKNLFEIESLISQYSAESVQLIRCKKNKGIAFALNAMSLKAITYGYEWLLTLDQDSISETEMIDSFKRYLNISRVGIICPIFSDKRRKNIKSQIPLNIIKEIEFCITSGALTNLDVYQKVGGYDDSLFIGLVDNEYCYRLRKANYKIVEDNSVILDHELGQLEKSRYELFFLRLGNIINSDIVKKLSYHRKVSPMRLYYATRNMIYLNNKYPRNKEAAWSNKTLVKNGVASIIRGKRKIELIKVYIKGIRDGKKLIDDLKKYY